MALLRCIFVALYLCYIVKNGYGYHSCQDLKIANPTLKSGKYSMYNGRGQQYQVYCEFHCHYGYTFLSKSTSENVDLKLLNPSRSEVLVRHMRSNGHQYDTWMKQITRHASLPLSIQYNKNCDYATPINHATMGPYLYLGFLPIHVARSRSIQGYMANYRDYTFRNCDSNPNSYLAFFINPNHRNPNGYYKRCCYSKLMRDWINVGRTASEDLPSDYFFQFEMHMGGCGGYAINGHNTLRDIIGAALGMRFELPRRVQNETIICDSHQ
ncbi:uncharacterized protein LOC123564503 [Mercenaria mercenaria]|uniref:uncharacterized protein LOC123564503 n=1 Tax=Mercenaria mercenaria TaxID=6596 RepID=UPI00234E9218|nr:uncharacterized protein LOC123564503 [Mercenaria mercenaria]